MNKKLLLFIFSICSIFFSCEKEDAVSDKDDNQTKPSERSIKGNVEKGPFVSGSEIRFQELNESLNLTGSNFTGEILNNDGSFDLGKIDIKSNFGILSSTGYFYSETKGDLSNGMISLQAFVDVNSNTSFNLNIISHLKKDRVMNLVKSGELSFNEANKKVQKELLSCFGLDKYAESDFSSTSITSGNDEAGIIIAISSLILAGSTEAELTESLSYLRSDFTETGKFSDNCISFLNESKRYINTSEITKNLIKRYESLGKTITIKNLKKYIDWDNNGIAGDEYISDEEDHLYFEMDTLYVPALGGTFDVVVKSNGKFSFEKNGHNDDLPIEVSNTEIFEKGKINFDKEIVNDSIVRITVPTSTDYVKNPEKLKIYDLIGNLYTQIIISQDTNHDIEPVISESGKNHLQSLFYLISKTYQEFHTMEAFYTNCFMPNPNDYLQVKEWTAFYNHESSVASYSLQYQRNAYSLLNGTLKFLEESNKNTVIYDITKVLRCMFSIDIINFWETVLINDKDDPIYSKELTMDGVIEKYESHILECLSKFRSDKHTDIVSKIFFPNKDLPAIILARMYIYQGNYAKALDILNSNFAKNTLGSSRVDSWIQNSTEDIYFVHIKESRGTYISCVEDIESLPLASFSEVVLMRAECAYKMGNTALANEILTGFYQARGLELNNSDDTLTKLNTAWKSELKGSNTYFKFLKRNNLAQQELGINDSQLYFK